LESNTLLNGSSIIIDILKGKTLTLNFGTEIGPLNYIEYLKYKISKKGYIPQNTFNLFFRGLILENEKTILDYGIGAGSRIHLVFISSYSFSPVISIEIEIGETITLSVKESNTVKNIKEKIEKSEHIEQNSQILYFEGNQLDDNTIIKEKNITKLYMCYKNNIKIYIYNDDYINPFINKDLFPYYNIRLIKNLIYFKENINENEQKN